MVRRKRDTAVNEENLKHAVVQVKQGKMSIRQVADQFNVLCSLVHRQCQNVTDENVSEENVSIVRPGHKSII